MLRRAARARTYTISRHISIAACRWLDNYLSMILFVFNFFFLFSIYFCVKLSKKKLYNLIGYTIHNYLFNLFRICAAGTRCMNIFCYIVYTTTLIRIVRLPCVQMHHVKRINNIAYAIEWVLLRANMWRAIITTLTPCIHAYHAVHVQKLWPLFFHSCCIAWHIHLLGLNAIPFQNIHSPQPFRLQSNSDGAAHSSAGHSSHFYQRTAQRGSDLPSGSGTSNGGQGSGSNHAGTSASSIPQECPLCYSTDSAQGFYVLLNCKHMACRSCLESYLTIEIFESRTEIACPECTEAMHPSDIQSLLRNFPTVMKKYEDFMVRRVLLCDPDTRWCPAPDCRWVNVLFILPRGVDAGWRSR